MLGRIWSVALVGLVVAVGGCSGKDPVGSKAPVYGLTIRGGDEQQGPAGSILSEELQVTVADPADEPVRGVVVRFRVLSGAGATLSDTFSVTGLDGVARVQARLGPAQGEYKFQASLLKQDTVRVTFTEVATAPPRVTSVTKTSFGGGDTLTITGTDFNSSLGGNTVFVGGSRARILSGTTTSLVVVVPACVTPGAVGIQVQVGTALTNSIAGTYTATSPQLSLNELEGITVSGAEVSRCLRLTGGGARYLVVPQFAGDSGLFKFGYFLGASESVAAALKQSARLEASLKGRNEIHRRFERMLREQEHRLAPQLAFTAGTPRPRGIAMEALTLGSTRSFKVLGNLEGTTFKTASAQLKYIGQNVLLYFDSGTPANGFTEADIQAFGNLFDKTLYELAVRTFGSESDIDGNGHIAVLFTPYVNALTPAAQCSTGGFVTGYFFGFDLDSRGTNSNKGEVFYALTPDPTGARSCAHSVAQVKSIVPATFIHELQHMISFNQHVLVRGGSDEDIWLNEGLSHIAEEVASRHYEAKCAGITTPPCRTNPTQIFPDSAISFISGDLLDAYDYLRRPDTISITTFRDFGELEERGAAWLFLRWLGDQKDSTIYGRLVQTRQTSIRNVEDKSRESFAALLGDFGIAAYTDSIPGVPKTAIPPRYRFKSRNFRQIYGRLFALNPGLLPAPFPITLKPLPLDGVSASMVQGTMDYYELRTLSSTPSVSLQFSTDPGRTVFPAKLQAQLGVFRLPASTP